MEEEYLLVSSQTTQQCALTLLNSKTLNTQRQYRNGGLVKTKTLAVIGNDYVLSAEENAPLLHVWPINSSDPLKTLRLILPEPANCLDVCPYNQLLAVGISEKLYVWHLSSGRLLSVHQKHFQNITCVKFSNNCDFVAVGGEDGLLVVYDCQDVASQNTAQSLQSEIGKIEPVYTKSDHALPITDIHIGSFGKHSRLITISKDGQAKIYKLNTGQLLLSISFNDPLSSLVVSSTGWQMFVGCTSGKIQQFSLKSPPKAMHNQIHAEDELVFTGQQQAVLCLDVNFAGTLLASGGLDKTIYIWEVKSRQIVKKTELKSSVTNLRFMLDHENIHIQILKPSISVKSLERNMEYAKKDLKISILQKADIEFEDNIKVHANADEDLLTKYQKLLNINQQLYKANLGLSEKYNGIQKRQENC